MSATYYVPLTSASGEWLTTASGEHIFGGVYVAILAHGTKLAMYDGSNFVDIAEVLDISGPGIKQETVDVTSHDSTWREHLATIADGGDVSFDINYIPSDTSQQALRAAVADHTNHQFKVTFTDGSTATFDGFVTSFEIGAPVADKLTASVEIKITGPVTWS